jgi:predicted DNA-binding protein
MLQIRIDPALEARLAAVAKKTGESPDALAGKALLAYLEELEDYAAAVEAMKDYDPQATISLDEVKRQLGLDA